MSSLIQRYYKLFSSLKPTLLTSYSLLLDVIYLPLSITVAIQLLKVTAKFRCVVRVVAAMPCQTEELCSPAGIYRMRLTLEDSTARIHAYVFAEDGVRTNFDLSAFRIFLAPITPHVLIDSTQMMLHLLFSGHC